MNWSPESLCRPANGNQQGHSKVDEGDESVDFFLGFKSAGGSFVEASFSCFSGIFRLCNRFFMQFFVIIKVTEKLEKKGKGHAPEYLSVSTLTKYLKMKFWRDPYLERVYLTGQVSNFRRRPNHQYFSLKDEKAVIQVTIWSGIYQKLGFELGRRHENQCNWPGAAHL